MNIRTHQVARVAYECVAALREDQNKKEYGALAHKLPSMILANGLAQATGFLLAKGKSEHHALLNDLNTVLRATGASTATDDQGLHQQIITSDLSQTLILTRRSLEASGWIKRYVQGVLRVNATGDTSDENTDAAGEDTAGDDGDDTADDSQRETSDDNAVECVDSLRPLYKKAAQDAHAQACLLLQRGLTEHDENDQKAKTDHIESVCQRTAGEFYKRTYKRWKQATANRNRFRRVFLKLETRLFIGLTGGGMLETGCAISHSHGMPYIPGSSVKGVVNAYARDRLGNGGADICDRALRLTAHQTAAGRIVRADFLSRRLVGSRFGLPSIGTRGRNLSPSETTTVRMI